MDKEIETKMITLMAAFMMVLVSLSIGVVAGQENDVCEDIVLVELYGISEEVVFNIFDDLNVDLIEHYDNAVLVEADKVAMESLENYGLTVSTIPKRTTIYVGGLEFDFREGEPEIPDELRVNDYEPGVKGQYIVHMVGPIARGWRPTLEGKGVQVLNYMHNHAYRVRMTPEVANEVSELYFVDWVGIYHPYYKIQPGLEADNVVIGSVKGASVTVVDDIIGLTDNVFSISDSGYIGGGFNVIAVVNNVHNLNEIARLNNVDHIVPNSEPMLMDEVGTQIIGGGCWFFDDEDDDPNTPYREHGNYGSYMNQIGYRGSGITIAVADSGIGDGTVGNAGHPDFTGRVVGGNWWEGPPPFWNYPDPWEGPFSEGWGDCLYICPEDEYKFVFTHGTHVAGIAAGNTYGGTEETFTNFDYYVAQGSAPQSKLYAQRLFDWMFIVEEPGGTTHPSSPYPIYVGPYPNFYPIVEEAAVNSSASIHTNSWGGDVEGMYDTGASSYDRATRDFNMTITVAAGNSGPDTTTIGSPATGKNVIAVGATVNYRGEHTNPDNVSSFSSRGWTQDNRIKPDVTAPGQYVNSTILEAGYELTYSYAEYSGTSMAAPRVAGAAAVTQQWYKVYTKGGGGPSPPLAGEIPSPTMVKALLINTANDLCNENGNTDPIPNRDEGWGIVDISKLERPLEDPVPFYLYDQEHIFDDSGQIHEHLIIPDREGIPLKFSLVWTDKEAGNVGDDPTLINDLNLEVIAPCGAVYRGNAFPVDNEGNSTSSYTSPNIDTMPVFDRNDGGWDDYQQR